jgi:predicted ABC-type transport system involved in lysophospholipase L1 biosynthesis ATPase subunit
MINKFELIKITGGTAESSAKRLGYSHRMSIQGLPEDIIGKQQRTILMRLRAAKPKIKFPKEWELDTILPRVD